MNQTYLIDFQVVAFLLDKPLESKDITNFMLDYAEKLDEVRQKAVKMHLAKQKSKQVDEITDVEYDEFVASIENYDFVVQPEYQEFSDMVDEVINQYNKKIYDFYSARISQDQKDKLNKYIQSKQTEANEQHELWKSTILQVLDEAEKQADEVSVEEAVKPQESVNTLPPV